MEFISTYWWLWLIALFLSLGYAGYNQINRMKRVMRLDEEGITKGLGGFVAAYIVSCASGVLLLIATIINLVTYINK